MNSQTVHLVVYKGPGPREWRIVDHSSIKHDSGDLFLRADLSFYEIPARCPQEPGLWLVEATATIGEGRWGSVRLAIVKARQITGGLEQIREEVRGMEILEGTE